MEFLSWLLGWVFKVEPHSAASSPLSTLRDDRSLAYFGGVFTACLAAATVLWEIRDGTSPMDAAARLMLAVVSGGDARGVLRRIGSVYQFRHAKLQGRLVQRGS